MRAAARIDADVPERELGVGVDGPRDQPERGSGHVPGDPFVHCLHPNPSFEAPGDLARLPRVVASDVNPARAQHAFRVVAGRDRLPDGRSAVGSQPGQQDR